MSRKQTFFGDTEEFWIGNRGPLSHLDCGVLFRRRFPPRRKKKIPIMKAEAETAIPSLILAGLNSKMIVCLPAGTRAPIKQ